jgi:hypothetical protein
MDESSEEKPTEAEKLSHLPNFAASSAAIKNVLSPISDKNIKENAAGNPDLPS